MSDYDDGLELMRRRRSIANAVLAENIRQDKKWGEERDLDPEIWMTILGEEFGETCQAALQHDPNYRYELIQVAAVAIAAIENFDRVEFGGEINN